jgi:adsorption protein B
MTVPDLLAGLLLAARTLLVLVSLCFLASGCDDFFFDVYHAVRAIYRRLFVLRNTPRLSIDRLCEKPEQPIAVMIPAWDESAVIRRMLEANLDRIRYANLHVFVGTYPNDPATQRQVELVRERNSNVHRFVCPKDGPTNKADCLNWIYQGIRVYEREHGTRFEVFALNDSEDVIHPLCFKLFNYLVPKLDMVQLPVIPLEVPWWHFTSGHYLDEFAESHGKDMVVREGLTGTIPAAGVGCGFSRRALELAAAGSNNQLFSLESLAEDYDLGLRLGSLGLKQAFVRVAIDQPVPSTPSQVTREYIAIREYFPSEFKAAVRQKARWIVGISFQGWRRLGWRGELLAKYALFRDRKGLVTNPTVALGYGVVIAVVTIWLLQWWDPEFYRFPAIVERGSWLWDVILVNTFFLCVRLFQRCRFVRQVYGWKQALLAMPRQVWANIVNVAAVCRAFYLFSRSLATGQRVAWDKTGHQFPSEETLLNARRRLGDLLLEKRLITVSQLEAALQRQQQSGRRLGTILRHSGLVSEDHIVEALAEQEHLPFRSVDPYSIPREVVCGFPRALAIRHSIFPLEDDGTRVVVAALRPIGESLRAQFEARLSRRLDICLTTESDMAFALCRAYGQQGARLHRPLLGERLIGSACVNQDQLREALQQQRRSYVRLGTLFEEAGVVSPQLLDEFMTSFDPGERRLGEALVAAGTVSREQLQQALNIQRKRFRRLGRVLVEDGVVSADALSAHLPPGRNRPKRTAASTRRRAAREVAALVAAFILITGASAWAQPSNGDRGPHTGTTLGDELRRFRMYPHLDRAYRLLKDRRVADARVELESTLSIEKNDLDIWLTYFEVLYQLKDYETLATRFEGLDQLRGDVRLRRYHLLAQLERQRPASVLEDLQILKKTSEVTGAELQEIVLRFVRMAREGERPELLITLLSAVGDAEIPPAVLYEAANTLRSLGSVDAASVSYQRVADAADAGSLRVDAHKALAAIAIEQHRFSDARLWFTRARDLQPRDLSLLRSVGDLAIVQADWRETIRCYRRWLTLSQGAVNAQERYHAYMILGNAYTRLEQHREAARAFGQALRARPRDRDAQSATAQALEQAHRPIEALHRLRAALRIAPTGDLNARTGLLMTQLGQQKEALPFLERARDLGVSPDLMPALFAQLGYAYASLTRFERARDAFERALPYAAHQAAIHAAIGRIADRVNDLTSAKDHFERSLALEDDPQVRRDLALVYVRMGDSRAAAELVEQLGYGAGTESPFDAAFLNQLGDVTFERGQFREAAAWYRRAYGRGNPPLWTSLSREAESLERAGVVTDADEAWDELAHSEFAPADARATAAERAGYARLRMADSERALANFLLAISLGRDGWRLRLDRALTFTKIGRWREALDESITSLDMRDTARGRIAAAFCFKALNKPGMAIYEFRRGLADLDGIAAQGADQVDRASQKNVFDELAYLYAAEGNYQEASTFAARSLTESADPAIALHLARMQRLLGRNEDARQTLRAIDGSSIAKPLLATVLDERASVSAALGDEKQAIDDLLEAVAIERSNPRLHQLGTYYRDVGDLANAVQYLRESLDLAPGNSRYRESLAYAHLQAGHLNDAAALLTTVAQQEPDNLQVQEDLANVLMRLGDRGGAVRWLRHAIEQGQSGEAPADEAGRLQNVPRMQRMVAQIEKRYEAAAYVGYHALAAPSITIGRPSAPLLLSQNGFELTRFITDAQHGWSLIGRVMSATDGATGGFGTRSAVNQLAFGIRYKPFREQNLSFSTERLVQLGELSNSWLVRALFSKQRGIDVEPDQRWHRYWLAYGDVAGFIGPFGSLLTYGEGRVGVTRSLNDSWTLQPHIVVAARRDLVGRGGDAIQLGVGAGITRHFKAHSYGGAISSLEIRMYGSGALVRTPAVDGSGGVGGLTLFSAVHF